MKWICLTIMLCAATFGRAETLVMLDGQRISGDIAAITGGEVSLANHDRAIRLQDLRVIERDVAAGAPSLFVQRLYLADGSVLIAHHVTVNDGVVHFDWIGGEGAALPAEQVRGILLAPLSAKAGGKAAAEEPFMKQVRDPQANQDHLLAIGEDALTVVPGVLQALDEQQATFVWNDQPRKIDRGKLYGVALAATAKPADLNGRVCAVMTDGSTVWGKVSAMADGKLTLDRPGGPLTLPWDQVVKLRVRSERLVFVSDMTPGAQDTAATVTYAWPMQTDQSVMGGPITLGGRTYERGLGVHARSALTYDLGGKFSQFAATIGLDDKAGDEGDCVFIVKADGRQLLQQRMKAGDGGKAIVLNVAGVKQLELIVQTGENLDIGDLADWADARVIR